MIYASATVLPKGAKHGALVKQVKMLIVDEYDDQPKVRGGEDDNGPKIKMVKSVKKDIF